MKVMVKRVRCHHHRLLVPRLRLRFGRRAPSSPRSSWGSVQEFCQLGVEPSAVLVRIGCLWRLLPGLGGGSTVAVVRSSSQIPALVVGWLLRFSGVEVLLFSSMVGACSFLLRRLAGGGVWQDEGWFSFAVVLVFLPRQRVCRPVFLCTLVCSTL